MDTKMTADDLTEYPEALEWLDRNGNDDPFAGNYFKSPADVREFFEGLYANGAVRVCIADIVHEDDDGNGNPYADAVYVLLPTDAERRDLLRQFIEQYEPDELEQDGPDVYWLWWD
jgi:hypothetical protein